MRKIYYVIGEKSYKVQMKTQVTFAWIREENKAFFLKWVKPFLIELWSRLKSLKNFFSMTHACVYGSRKANPLNSEGIVESAKLLFFLVKT